jgi:mRNA-degrading endonuclease toxin of MazEF toxin-antitoxin module
MEKGLTYSTTTRQWTLCWVDPEYAGITRGDDTDDYHIQTGRRLGIVVSNDVANSVSQIATVVLCSTKTHKDYLPINYKFFCRTTQLYNIAMCNQILTVPTIKLGQLDEQLSEEDREGIKRCLEAQFNLTLKDRVQYRDSISNPQTIVKTEVVEKEVIKEVIKEVLMASIDDKYKAYLDAKAFEEEAKRLTREAYADYLKSVEQFKAKLQEHLAIIAGSEKVEVQQTPEAPKPEIQEGDKTSGWHWTPQQIDHLQSLGAKYGRDYIINNASKIAQDLGRSEGAVIQKAKRLGLLSKRNKGNQ